MMEIKDIQRELRALSKGEFREKISPILHSEEGRKIICYGHAADLSPEEKRCLTAAIKKAGFSALADNPETFIYCAMSQLATNAGL